MGEHEMRLWGRKRGEESEGEEGRGRVTPSLAPSFEILKPPLLLQVQNILEC